MAKRALMTSTVAPTIAGFNMENMRILQEMGYEVDVAADFTDNGRPIERMEQFKARLEQLGIRHFQVDFSRNPVKIGRHIAAYGQIKRVIDDGQYDIIHCHTPICAALTRLAASDARKRGTKVFYTAHGFHFYKGAPLVNWLLYYPVERLLAPKTDVLITINREDYERAKTFKAGRVEYVPGVGLDTRKFQERPKREPQSLRRELGIPLEATVLLSVGEVNRNKNHQLVLRALPKLKNAYYVICGEGPLMDELRGLSQTLNVSGRFIMAGYRTDVADFYQMADIFVFPSLREGLPVSLMEAMASGLPAVCSDIRGNRDLIENGKSGVLVEQKPEAVAEAIRKLMADASLRERYAQEAARTMQGFDMSVVNEKANQLYSDEMHKQYRGGGYAEFRQIAQIIKRQQLRRELGIPLDATVLLSVGEVNRNKNHELVLRTLPKLENAYYVICGAGPLMNTLRNLSQKLNVSERFIMVGYRTDVADFYKMADIFTFPSLREGLGMALLEALVCGLPSLAMNTRGPADIIRDGENGFLMENDVNAWANKIRQLCREQETLWKLRRAAPDSVSQYDINQVLPIVKKLYAFECPAADSVWKSVRKGAKV